MVEQSQRIYVASSWRNNIQPILVTTLREAGFEVYDFKDHGFGWDKVCTDWQDWTNEEYVTSLKHPAAIKGFQRDLEAMEWADTFVLVQPCGRSAHLELGWATGKGKRTCILLNSFDPVEPELMANLADHVAVNVMDLLEWLGVEN